MLSLMRKAVNRPFMTDDLPHVICSILGIHTKWYSIAQHC